MASIEHKHHITCGMFCLTNKIENMGEDYYKAFVALHKLYYWDSTYNSNEKILNVMNYVLHYAEKRLNKEEELHDNKMIYIYVAIGCGSAAIIIIILAIVFIKRRMSDNDDDQGGLKEFDPTGAQDDIRDSQDDVKPISYYAGTS